MSDWQILMELSVMMAAAYAFFTALGFLSDFNDWVDGGEEQWNGHLVLP